MKKIFFNLLFIVAIFSVPVIANDVPAAIEAFAKKVDCYYPNEKIFCFYQDVNGDGNDDVLCSYSRTNSSGDMKVWNHRWYVGVQDEQGKWIFDGEVFVFSDFEPLIFIKTEKCPTGAFVRFSHRDGVLGISVYKEEYLRWEDGARERVGVDIDFFNHLPKLSPRITSYDLPAWKKRSRKAVLGEQGMKTRFLGSWLCFLKKSLIVFSKNSESKFFEKPLAPDTVFDEANFVVDANVIVAKKFHENSTETCVFNVKINDARDDLVLTERLRFWSLPQSVFPQVVSAEKTLSVCVDVDELDFSREWILNGDEKWLPTKEGILAFPPATFEIKTEAEHFRLELMGAFCVPAPSETRSRNLRCFFIGGNTEKP